MRVVLVHAGSFIFRVTAQTASQILRQLKENPTIFYYTRIKIKNDIGTSRSRTHTQIYTHS